MVGIRCVGMLCGGIIYIRIYIRIFCIRILYIGIFYIKILFRANSVDLVDQPNTSRSIR